MYLMGMVILKIGFVLLTLTHSVFLFASGQNCKKAALSESYRLGNHFSIDPTVAISTRRPEAGSLEDRHPGVVMTLPGKNVDRDQAA